MEVSESWFSVASPFCIKFASLALEAVASYKPLVLSLEPFDSLENSQQQALSQGGINIKVCKVNVFRYLLIDNLLWYIHQKNITITI